MILNGDVGLGLRGVFALDEMGREHQELDSVKLSSELEVMHLIDIVRPCLPDHERYGGGSPSMTCKPRERAVDLFADLADEDGFDVAA